MPTSSRLSAMGLPTLAVSSCASSSPCSSTWTANRRRSRARSAGATARQAGPAASGPGHRGVGLVHPGQRDLGQWAASVAGLTTVEPSRSSPASGHRAVRTPAVTGGTHQCLEQPAVTGSPRDATARRPRSGAGRARPPR